MGVERRGNFELGQGGPRTEAARLSSFIAGRFPPYQAPESQEANDYQNATA